MKNHYSFLRNSVMAIGVSLFASQSIGQIITVNQDWDHVGVLQGTSKLVATDTDPSGNLVYVSNRMNGTNTEIYLSCRHKGGNLVWEEFLFSSGDDYGVDLSIDPSGNIYVLGAKDNNGQYDYHLVKYSTSGALQWETTYDGNGMDDVPSSLIVDASGDIYITGFERKSLTNIDMATLKVSQADGSILWSSNFGSSSLMENGLDIEVTQSGKIIVCGGSMNFGMTTNFKIVSYDANSGAELQSDTRDSRMIFDEPMEMKVAGDGGIYITGSSEFQGNRDIEVFAYNSDLNFLWNRKIDYEGVEDMGRGLTITSDNAPVITGFCTRDDNSTFIYTSKLSPQNGSTVWEDIRSARTYEKAARGNAITSDAQGNVYVAGEMERENQRDFVLFSLDSDGEIRFQKYFDSGDPMGNDIPQDIVIYGDIIYVTGRTELAGEKHVQTLKYRVDERTITYKHQ